MTIRKTAYRRAMEIAECADKAGELPYELVNRLYAAGLITTNTESDRLAGEPYQWGRRGRATDQDDTEQQEKEAMAVTSKQIRAAKLIEFANKRGYTPTQTAEMLNKFDLLAPDLPEPNDPGIFVPDGKGWLPGGPYGPSVWTAPDSTVMVQRIEPGDLTPAEARRVALAVLAAVEESETMKEDTL